MKKLSLFLFTILILGCGTETTVVEEPVVEEPPPVVMEDEHAMLEDAVPPEDEHAMLEDTVPPEIVEGSVHDDDVNVDPEPLNRNGIIFEFTEPLNMYAAELRFLNHGSLGWSPLDVVDHRDIGNQIHLKPMADSELLEYDMKYWLLIYAQDLACNGAQTSIIFRTKPR